MELLVINLDRSRDRRAYMEAQFRDLSLDYEIFSGIDGTHDLPPDVSQYSPERCIRRFGAPLSPPEVGTFASHYGAWNECIRRNRPLAILEDDVVLSPSFPEALALADKRIAEHRLIRLAGLFDRPFRLIEAVGSWQMVRFLRGPSGGQCYVVSPQAAQALVAGAQAWTEPADDYLDRFWHHGVAPKAILPYAVECASAVELPSLIGTRDRRRDMVGKLRREVFRVVDTFFRSAYNLIQK